MTTLPVRNEKLFNIPIPTLGLNTADDPSQMSPLFASDLKNVEIDDFDGYAKRSGFTQFNTGMMPVTFTGTISGITGTHVGAATGTAVWSGVVTAGMLFRMASGSNIYKISNLISNASIGLMSSYSDTVTTGSYYISCPGVDGLYNYKYGTTQKLIAFGGGTGFSCTAASSGEWVNFWDSLKDGQFVSAITFQDKLLYCNGYQFNQFDGTTPSAVGGTPDPGDPVYVCNYTIGNANYVCAIGSKTTTDMSKFAFCDVNAYETWPAANIYYAGDRDGGVLTGGCQCPNGLLLFKDNGVFMFGGIPGSGSLKKLSSIGCSSPKTIVAYEGNVYFVGINAGSLGVYMYAGGNEIQCISEAVEPTIDGAKKTLVAKICAEVYDNKYVVSYPSSTATFNDSHISFYLNRGSRDDKGRIIYPAIKGNRGMNVIREVDIAATPYLLSGSPTSGYVYREDNGTTDDTTDNIYGGSSAIDAYVTTKWFDFGRVDINKEVLRGYINAKAVGDWYLYLDCYKDFQGYGYNRYRVDITNDASLWSGVVFLSTPWQTSKTQMVEEVNFDYPNIGRYFKYKWGNANASEYFTVFPLTVFLKEEAR